MLNTFGSLPGKHHTVSTVQYCIGHVAGLSTGGAGLVHHAFQHLGREEGETEGEEGGETEGKEEGETEGEEGGRKERQRGGGRKERQRERKEGETEGEEGGRG